MTTSSISFLKLIRSIGAILFWLVVWQLLALKINEQLFLAPPAAVFRQLIELVALPSFWGFVLRTFSHIMFGFLLAFFAGILFAALASSTALVKTLLQPLMTLIKATPVPSFILLVLVFAGSKNLSTIISLLIVLPVIYTNLLTGIEQISVTKFEAANVFQMSSAARLHYIYIPETAPYLLSSCAAGQGLAWKSGIAAEVIGIATGTIGEQLYNAKLFLDTSSLFAYTLVIVIISLLTEQLFLLLLRRTTRYAQTK